MLWHFQPNRKLRDMSISLTKMGGYKRACHMVALVRIALRPKARKRTCGDALTKESTIPDVRPGGDIAGARAMKTSTFWLRVG